MLVHRIARRSHRRPIVAAALAVAALALAPAALTAQEPSFLVLDLAKAAPQEESSFPTGPVEVLLLNCIPEATYATSWAVQRQPIAQLTLPQQTVAPAQAGALAAADACTELDQAITELIASADESQVAARAAVVREKRAQCADPELGSEAERVLQSTQRRITLPVALGRGDRGTLTITRVSKAGESKTWTRVLDAPALGRWLNSFGFNFVANDDEEFAAQTVTGQQNQFRITSDEDREDYDFRPAVFFTWVPGGWDWTPASLGITGGLDFENGNVAVFLGPSLFFGDNLHLALGAAIHQVRRLRGEYDEGQILATQVAADQLTETTYRPSLFAGIGFRFDRSPFETAQTPAAGGE